MKFWFIVKRITNVFFGDKIVNSDNLIERKEMPNTTTTRRRVKPILVGNTPLSQLEFSFTESTLDFHGDINLLCVQEHYNQLFSAFQDVCKRLRKEVKNHKETKQRLFHALDVGSSMSDHREFVEHLRARTPRLASEQVLDQGDTNPGMLNSREFAERYCNAIEINDESEDNS